MMSIASDFLAFWGLSASGIGSDTTCSSIDFAFQCTAWPLILLEKHCKLWEKGSLLTSLTSQVSTAASLGVDELSPGSAAPTSSASAGDLPALLRLTDRSSRGRT